MVLEMDFSFSSNLDSKWLRYTVGRLVVVIRIETPAATIKLGIL